MSDSRITQGLEEALAAEAGATAALVNLIELLREDPAFSFQVHRSIREADSSLVKALNYLSAAASALRHADRIENRRSV